MQFNDYDDDGLGAWQIVCCGFHGLGPNDIQEMVQLQPNVVRTAIHTGRASSLLLQSVFLSIPWLLSLADVKNAVVALICALLATMPAIYYAGSTLFGRADVDEDSDHCCVQSSFSGEAVDLLYPLVRQKNCAYGTAYGLTVMQNMGHVGIVFSLVLQLIFVSMDVGSGRLSDASLQWSAWNAVAYAALAAVSVGLAAYHYYAQDLSATGQDDSHDKYGTAGAAAAALTDAVRSGRSLSV